MLIYHLLHGDLAIAKHNGGPLTPGAETYGIIARKG